MTLPRQRSVEAIETDLRRASIAAQLADAHGDCARLVRLREQQERWLDEWAATRRDGA